MKVKEARELLGANYTLLPDKTIELLIELVESVCRYIISAENSKVDTGYLTHDNHDNP